MHEKNTVQEVLSRFDVVGECHIHRGGKDWDGYALCKLGNVSFRAHRLSWEFHNNSKIPHGEIVMHSCDNPPCINPAHLSVGTTKKNMEDKHDKGRAAVQAGPSNNASKVTPQMAEEAKKRLLSGEKRSVIAKSLGISKGTLELMCYGKHWSTTDDSDFVSAMSVMKKDKGGRPRKSEVSPAHALRLSRRNLLG